MYSLSCEVLTGRGAAGVYLMLPPQWSGSPRILNKITVALHLQVSSVNLQIFSIQFKMFLLSQHVTVHRSNMNKVVIIRVINPYSLCNHKVLIFITIYEQCMEGS